MRAWIAMALIVLMMAGCLAGPKGSDASPSPTSPLSGRDRLALPAKIAFAAPTLLGAVTSGAEPSIAAGADGTVYVVTPLALWRSDDGGKTYKGVGTPYCAATTPVPPPTCPPGYTQYRPGVKGGGDSDIYVGPDNRVHWLGLADGNNAVPYQVSTDKGEKWSDVVDLAGEDNADREWITGRTDGTLFAAWRNMPASGSGRSGMIVSRVSVDGGATWGNTTEIAKDTRQGGIAVDPTSNALALAYDTGTGEVYVAHSSDNATTWNSTLVVDDPLQGQVFPVTTYDANGTLYLAFAHDRVGLPTNQVQNRPLEHPNVYLMVSHDKGATWTKPLQVNAPGTTAWFPWIAAGLPGRVALVWYQNDKGLPRQTADEVYPMAGITLDADLEAPHFKNVRMSVDPIHRGPECRENPGACTRSFLDFFEVAIHPNGYPVATFAQDLYPVPRVNVQTSYMTDGPNFLQ